MDCSDFSDLFDMVNSDEDSTQCAVYDQTPNSEQKRINIVVRPSYTVEKVINDIQTQFGYESFDLVLQPKTGENLIYLNEYRTTLIYKVPTFNPIEKNILILLPIGLWDGNTKKKYDITMSLKISVGSDISNNAVVIKQNETFLNGKEDTAVNFLNETLLQPASTHIALNATAEPSGACTDLYNPSPMSDQGQSSDDDLALWAPDSPAESESRDIGTLMLGQSTSSRDRENFETADKEEKYQKNDEREVAEGGVNGIERKFKYIGLVNQAMTCYLNSLLQALFMTPEFRNALYRWVFDNDNADKNIPYQLQKLFLNLQTSKQPAVETTDLTRSFGWDSTEAWQQHDVQELCRVMFDALEQKFNNTEQANLISNLYEGKMIDYVRCLECNTEKTRADTFLDIPLPVRPFGKTEAYRSIEEALCAFVQPETLDGNNQYFCEKCNKKCDAHKGLKFKNFPYILTLHLKRFDFDYQTMHRIKLNDKVTFPETLNLNSFICLMETDISVDLQSTAENCNSNSTSNGYSSGNSGDGSSSVTTDDCSTTDSGSAMEEDNCSNGIATTANSSQHDNEMNEDDEGIDMGNSVDLRHNQETGPYIYELFAIMIHSGSASGGHYYAYIKEFDSGKWFCFNDQSVSPITQEEIQKSFGGNCPKTYYSSVYSSSTNAYMLMYRQIDSKRNETPIKASNFPKHINERLLTLNSETEFRGGFRSARHMGITDLALPEIRKPHVYFYNPDLQKLKVTRVYVSKNYNLRSVLESAYQQLNVEKFAPLSRCRLVGYDHSSEDILQSFEHVSDAAMEEIRISYDGSLDFLLEYCVGDQEFEVYGKGGTTWNVFVVDLRTLELDGPHFVHSSATEGNAILKRSICARFSKPGKEMLLATMPRRKVFIAFENALGTEAEENFCMLVRRQFRQLTYFYLSVPSTDITNLEILGVPMSSNEVTCDEVDAVAMNGGVLGNQETPLSPFKKNTARLDSNSEDSSLTDGDRTLVQSAENRGGGDSHISSKNLLSELSSSEEESFHDCIHRIYAYFNAVPATQYGDHNNIQLYKKLSPQFFQAIKIQGLDPDPPSTNPSIYCSTLDDDASFKKIVQTYKIIVSSNMDMNKFKEHIGKLIQVPGGYFKIQRKDDALQDDSPPSLIFLIEGETLVVHIGKELEPEERKARIFYLSMNDLSDTNSKLPCVCEWVHNTQITVAQAKKDLVSKLHRIDKKYQGLAVDNCRLWMKAGRYPVKIFSDEETMCSNIRTCLVLEIVVQECAEKVQHIQIEDHLTFFFREWNPEKYELGPFKEITFNKTTEIRNALSKLSGIKEENIAYCKVNGAFPCNNLSVLSINGTMIWVSLPATVADPYLLSTNNGSVFYFKDVTKTPIELSLDERAQINMNEKLRLERIGCISAAASYSPRREKALKIYLDTPSQGKVVKNTNETNRS